MPSTLKESQKVITQSGATVVVIRSKFYEDDVTLERSRSNVWMDLHQGGGMDDGAYYPPSHVCIVGEQIIIDLRDALNSMFPPKPVAMRKLDIS